MKFDDFSKTVVDQWASFVKASSAKIGPRLRVLYDFRKCGAPSPYALQRVGPVMQSIDVPPNTKTAHLYKSSNDTQFTEHIVRMMPENVGEVQAFSSYQDALKWLSY